MLIPALSLCCALHFWGAGQFKLKNVVIAEDSDDSVNVNNSIFIFTQNFYCLNTIDPCVLIGAPPWIH